MDANYTKNEAVFEDGELWYYTSDSAKNKYRQRIASYAKKNTTRMFVNGKYISKKHPLWKPGNYKTWSDAASLKELKRTKTGHVYVISNPAWGKWLKVGRAVDAHDRVKQYQTSSPFRDYKVELTIDTDDTHVLEKQIHKKLRSKYNSINEWFEMSLEQFREMQ